MKPRLYESILPGRARTAGADHDLHRLHPTFWFPGPGTYVNHETQTVGRYRLEEMICAGGMGVRFRAFDAKLWRDLAIKVLAPGSLVRFQAGRA